MMGWIAPASGETGDETGGEPVPLDEFLDGIEPSGPPETFADAEQQLSEFLAGLLDPDPLLVLILFAGAVALLIAALVRQLIAAKPDSPSPGPTAVAASLICALLYGSGRLLDLLPASMMERPLWFPEDAWDRVGWLEWQLLDRPWAWGAMPLADHPTLALIIHVVVWAAVWLVASWILELIWVRNLRWSAPTRDLPWYYRWLGASTTRRADGRFWRWIAAPLPLLALAHVVAGLTVIHNPGAVPAPGAWVVGGMVIWTLAYHLLVRGKPPAEDDDDDDGDQGEDENPLDEPSRAPLARLRQAVEGLRPGVHLEALEQRSATRGERAPFPAAIAPLVREIFEDLTGETQPWVHQSELLAHFGELWRMQATPERGEVPLLVEERGGGVVSQARGSTPHALMLAPEGAGRTTASLLAALHVFFDRGATSLVVVRERGAATRWAERLQRALLGSSARWNVLVCVAGDNLGPALVAGRTPAIVICDLETCESEVLCDPRTDDFLARLGLVVADDVDGFTGVAEMHVQLCMRRLWALLDRLHVAAYPVALLATAGAGASGMDAWAKHVLAVPMRLFDANTAPTRQRVLLRRRDLVDGIGTDLPLAVLAEACDRAALPWHLRLAGDGERSVSRAMFDLGSLRRHHRDDPRTAAVVLVEGTYPAVRREADRLAHMGLALDEDAFPESSPVVLVLAPPGDEEMVLHEEADDAVHRELVASLPRAVPLSEPHVVRQRHFDRAVGREQELSALRERFGTRFVDETIAELGGALRRREILHIDPLSDDIVPQTLLRAVKEGALGQPIDAACVGERGSRAAVIDAGTSEHLLSIDAALARAVYPPGRIFLHPRGRFMLIDDHGEGGPPERGAPERELRAEQIDSRERTTLDRTLELEFDADPQWSERQLGGRKLPVALGHASLVERLHGVRRYAPGPTLVDQRIYERAIEVRYGTDVCLIDTLVPAPAPPSEPERSSTSEPSADLPAQASRPRLTPAPEPGPGPAPWQPGPEALTPLVAALRMILPGYLRASAESVDLDLVDHRGRVAICVFDRTLGGSGFARYVCERGLRELLELGRMVLERCVGPEFARLRHIHDRTPQAEIARWRVGEALRWLDGILDIPPTPDDDEPELGGPIVAFTPGEGVGDLGRLWMSETGRSDDLVWTRHSWWSPIALADQPRGKLSFDVAVERPAIAAARRRAVELASRFVLRSNRLDLESSEIYERIINDERETLSPIRETLARLCADDHGALITTVLALIAAIPNSPRGLSMSERGPLAVLATRRADADAKLILACALLPVEAHACVVTGPDGQGWIRIDHGPREGERSTVKTWSLHGPRPVEAEAQPAARATMVLDFNENPAARQ